MRKIQGKFNLKDMDLASKREITYPGTKGFCNDPSNFQCNSRKYKQKP